MDFSHNDSSPDFSHSPPPPSSVDSRRRGGGHATRVIDLTMDSSPDSPMRMRFSIPQSQVLVDLGSDFGSDFHIDTPRSENGGGNEISFRVRESIASSSSSSSESEAEFDENDNRFKAAAGDDEEVDYEDISFIVDSDDEFYDIATTSGSGSEVEYDEDSLSDNDEEDQEGDEAEVGEGEEGINSNGGNGDRETSKENVFDFGELQEIIMEYTPVKPIKASAMSPLEKKETSSRRPLQEREAPGTTPERETSARKDGKKISKKEAEAAASQAFNELNLRCFDNALPFDLAVSWNKRLRTTAGVTKMKTKGVSGAESVRIASIELSQKVVDDIERVRTTLLHEMCHAAAWLVDGEKKPPHGPAFWKWASIAGARSGGILVTTCHNYDIHRPFKWVCANNLCGIEYTRHSKKGIDPLRHRCGKCRGKIAFVGAFNADMTPRKTRAATGFSLFVQEHFASVKSSLKKQGKMNAHQPVMKELSRLYAISKNTLIDTEE